MKGLARFASIFAVLLLVLGPSLRPLPSISAPSAPTVRGAFPFRAGEASAGQGGNRAIRFDFRHQAHLYRSIAWSDYRAGAANIRDNDARRRTAWRSPDGESSPDWPPEYRAVWTVIVHHTVTGHTATDWAAEVRAISYYHATLQGWNWGDIGNNVLIDPNGNIYEGRADGDDVVGGHALQYNQGSLGVALLGNYQSGYPTAEV
ncbi:MAG: N-acetylmuramoyl-L-alanine amidase [Chloroflexi bacterium]|nr:N-acetylmuramoyl-L-alanine amidase [Chloroflexota bacterium]